MFDVKKPTPIGYEFMYCTVVCTIVSANRMNQNQSFVISKLAIQSSLLYVYCCWSHNDSVVRHSVSALFFLHQMEGPRDSSFGR